MAWGLFLYLMNLGTAILGRKMMSGIRSYYPFAWKIMCVNLIPLLKQLLGSPLLMGPVIFDHLDRGQN
jgi:hypothetical protein